MPDMINKMDSGKLIPAELLQKAVANYKHVDHNTKIEILSIMTSPGCSKGENFLCSVVLLDIRFQIRENSPETVGLFAKLIPNHPVRAQMLKEIKIVEVETEIYSRYFQRLDLFENVKVPICYLAENDVLLIENLRKKGFRIYPHKLGK